MEVAVVQSGQCGPDVETNVDGLLNLVRDAVASGAELVVFPELCTTQYFASAPYDESFRGWGESVPGHTTNRFAEVCRDLNIAVAFGMLELGSDGNLYNALVFLDRFGQIVPGCMADGSRAGAFRKLTAPTVALPTLTADEAAYCAVGPGPMVFDVDGARYGALICYDRSFSEAWLANRWLGGDIVVVAASSMGWREHLFVHDLRLRAMELGVFVFAANRAGVETCGGVTTDYFGRSCIIAPDGQVLAEARSHAQPEILRASVDVSVTGLARRSWPVWADRRPELYRFMYEESRS